MKRNMLCTCIVFVLSYPVMAQGTFPFEEYDDLRPDINAFEEQIMEDGNIARKLLFFEPLRISPPKSRPIIIYDTLSNTLNLLPVEQIGKERDQMISTYFWDPYTKMNYMYCSDIFNRNEERGWYSLEFYNKFLSFHLQNGYNYWANNSPPSVQLSDTRYFTVQYEIENYDSGINPRGYLTSHKTTSKIIDVDLNKTVWELNIATDDFINFYWITEKWYIQNRYYFALGEAERQNTIYNYETNEKVSFSPEIIIGYGEGVILTTTETDNGFIGISVWSPDKKIMYRDSNFLFSGIIDREHVDWGKLAIHKSYFDYPYIYCNLALGRGNYPPYGTLIMNLEDNKTHFISNGYHLFGIF